MARGCRRCWLWSGSRCPSSRCAEAVGSGSSNPRAPRAAPFFRDLQISDLGAYLRSLEGQVQAMALEIDVLRQLLQEAGLISSASFSAWVREVDGRRLSWNALRCVDCGSSDLVVAIQPV